MRLLSKTVDDPDVLWLINNIIESYSNTPDTGIPLGNVTSQLFANVYLNQLDRFIKHDLIRTKTKKRMLKKLNHRKEEMVAGKITGDSFNQTLQSYFGLLRCANTHRLVKKLENLINFMLSKSKP